MNVQLTILHLSLIEDVGPSVVKQILEHKQQDFDVVDLYSLLPSDFSNLFGLSTAIATKISQGLADRALLEREIALIERHGISWVTVIDEHYPHLLASIHLPPLVLYFRGAELHSSVHDNEKMIAIVGSRKANQYGQRAINQIVPSLVAYDWVTVSGGALGIDSMVHRATIDAGGRTVAVLGSGLLQPYPTSNNRLFDSIVDTGGTLVSSFPVHMDPLPGNFPARNRVIAGLSKGCVVVQAAQKSGALITAKFALEQSREVFAVPGPIDDVLTVGCHDLIQQGAKLIMGVDDIVVEFEHEYPIPVVRHENVHDGEPRVYNSRAKPVMSYDPSSPEGLILSALAQHQHSVDDLLHATGVSLSDLNATLLNLQFAGLISQTFCGQWELLR